MKKVIRLNVDEDVFAPVNLVNDWDSGIAVIDMDMLKTISSHVPKVTFEQLKEGLCDTIMRCDNKKSIKENIDKALNFIDVMDNIREFEMTDCEDMAEDKPEILGKIDLSSRTCSYHDMLREPVEGDRCYEEYEAAADNYKLSQDMNDNAWEVLPWRVKLNRIRDHQGLKPMSDPRA